jgi:hypothetical protein
MAGFYRYKYDNLTVGDHVITVTINDVSYSKTVRINPFCDNSLYLKYIDHNGQYRFYIFNPYYEKKESPKLIGSANNVITELLTAQSNTKNIGYTSERIITAIAYDVPQDELDLLSDLYTSPRIYLQIGSTDNTKDWLLVTVKSKDNLIKRKKGNFYNVEIEITLPDTNTIKML